MPVELESVKGMRKAAVLCVLLGEDVSSTLFRSLWEDEVEALSKEISQLSNIHVAHSADVLQQTRNDRFKTHRNLWVSLLNRRRPIQVMANAKRASCDERV